MSTCDKMGIMAKIRYIQDYEIEVALDDKGKEKKTLKYCGPRYDISFSGLTYRVYKRVSFSFYAALVISHVASGFAANQGMYQIYIALPFAIAFLTITLLGFNLFTLPKDHLRIRRDEMELSFKKIKINSAITLFLLIMVILGEIIYFITHTGNDQLVPELLFLFPELISVLVVFGLLRLHQKVQIQKIEE